MFCPCICLVFISVFVLYLFNPCVLLNLDFDDDVEDVEDDVDDSAAVNDRNNEYLNFTTTVICISLRPDRIFK